MSKNRIKSKKKKKRNGNKRLELNNYLMDKMNKVYDSIPETKGCMENIAKEEGSCGGICCKYQNPSVLYVEFINSWKYVVAEWDVHSILDLIDSALGNYLTSSISKTCIFWDTETKLCRQHKTRPYNCYIYGITPQEEFDERKNRLRVLYQHDISTHIRDQCDLVETEDGSIVTTEDTNRWWQEMTDIEIEFGIDPSMVNDGPGGTYRTYHDHLLMHVLPPDMMQNISDIKSRNNIVEMTLARKQLMVIVREKVGNRLSQLKV